MSGATASDEPTAPRRITLLTDFGTADGYVGAMRGVIAGLAPHVIVDNVSHDIPPGDIRAAAFSLGRYWRTYPAGTVHLVVVDPGVGGPRRAIAVRVSDRFILAPDNGVVDRVLFDAPHFEAVSIENPARMHHPVSATFHGRDLFAPAAAHIARGGEVADLGPAVTRLERLDSQEPERTGGIVTGIVLQVDRFGNLITNVPKKWVGDGTVVFVGNEPVGSVRRSYVDVRRGERLALIGSSDLLEISVRDGSAAEALAVGRGANITVRPAG
jgi:S-adenosylmethionine hydrolase